MTCISCDTGAPAHALGIATQEPAGEVLCPLCLLWLLRQRARYRCSRPDCDRRLLLGPDRECAWCLIGRPVSEDIDTVKVPVTILRGAAYLALRDATCKDGSDDESEKMASEIEDP